MFCYNPALEILPDTSPERNGRTIDYELIWHGLNRVPLLGYSSCDVTTFAEPSLGGVVIPIPNTEKRWLARLAGVNGMKAGSLAMRSDARLARVTGSVFTPLAFEREWAFQLSRLFMCRNIPTRPLTLTKEAQTILFNFQNELMILASTVRGHAVHLILSWPPLAVRIAQGIHFTENIAGIIKPDSMQAAVRLTRHHGARQLAAWLETQEEKKEAKEDVEVELLLMRIKVKGPLTQRQLYRTYNDQRKALHEPAILRLLSEGRIVQDEQGRLLTAEANMVTDALTH